MREIEVYIPTDDTKFDVFQNHLLYRVTPHAKRWEIPDEEIEKLKAQQKVWKDLRIQTYGGYGRASVKDKNETKRAYIKLIRAFIQQWIVRNEKMADYDKVLAGFKLKPKPRTFIPPPHLIPEIHLKFIDPLQVRVRMIPPKKRSQFGMIKKVGKPQDVEFIHIVYDIGEHQGGPTECRFRVMLKKMFTTLYFDPADAGKMVTLYARYMNKKSEPGHWSSAKLFRVR